MTMNVEDLATMFESVATKRTNGETVSLKDEYRAIPVPVRVMLAAVILAAADQPLTGNNLASAGAFSRGSTLRDYGNLVTSLRDTAPQFVAQALTGTTEGRSVATLTAELQQRDETIASLRAQLKRQEHDIQAVRSYARDLHERYRQDIEQVEREQADKVRHLRPIDQ